MKNARVFIVNLIDATKSGRINWAIDTKYVIKTDVKCHCMVDETKVIVTVSMDENANIKRSNLHSDRIHLYDSKNFKGGSSIFLDRKDYKEVDELYDLIYRKIAKPYREARNDDELNDKYLKKLADKIGRSFFRGRRLDKILKKKK